MHPESLREKRRDKKNIRNSKKRREMKTGRSARTATR